MLLVEDNVDLNDANLQALRLHGYEVHVAFTLEEGRQFLAAVKFDVILLDVVLPDGNGFDFCEEIRDITSAHIIFLTAKAGHENMVKGLTNGGDAYITKPFDSEEMLVKVKAAIRRCRLDSNHKIVKGNLTLELTMVQAFVNGKPLNLTAIEFALLSLFVENEGVVLNSTYIYESVWQTAAINYQRALQSAISKLRNKIVDSDYSIFSKYGSGYVFEKS